MPTSNETNPPMTDIADTDVVVSVLKPPNSKLMPIEMTAAIKVMPTQMSALFLNRSQP